jgi:hypothetical protein
MQKPSSISVQRLQNYPALLMKWEKLAESKDLKQAYRLINEQLRDSDKPLYVVVDLRENKNMPLAETVSGALFGPYQNPKLAACLVLGCHKTARMAARLLVNISHEDKIECFETEADIFAKLEANNWDISQN